MLKNNIVREKHTMSGGSRPDRHETITTKKSPLAGQGSGGGSNGGGKDDCNSLSFSTQVASPNPAVIHKLRHGFSLDVQLVSESTVQVKYEGDIVGVLVGFQANRLIECIKKGVIYKASITLIVGGQIKVIIKAVG